MNLLNILLWAHLLCMVGAFGGVLLLQRGTPASLRADPEALRPAIKWLNILIGAGLLFGVLLYGLTQGHTRGAHFNGVIGFKFGMLIAVGALLAVSRRSNTGDTLRWIAAALLAVAAFAAATL
jgi:hypothetical protein